MRFAHGMKSEPARTNVVLSITNAITQATITATYRTE